MYKKINDKLDSVEILSLSDYKQRNPALKWKYRNQKNVFLVEIAGRDSLAAIVKVIQDTNERPLTFVFSSLYHPGLYGDFSTAQMNVSFLQKKYHSDQTTILFQPLIFLDISQQFRECILQTMGQVQKRYGFYSPCHPCHLLLHLARVPLAEFLGISQIITGERIKHDTKEKINQYPLILDFYRNFLQEFNIRLIQPLYSLTELEMIEQLIGEGWNSEDDQYKCLFSKNYYDEKGHPIFSDDQVLRQLKEFYAPKIKNQIMKV